LSCFPGRSPHQRRIRVAPHKRSQELLATTAIGPQQRIGNPRQLPPDSPNHRVAGPITVLQVERDQPFVLREEVFDLPMLMNQPRIVKFQCPAMPPA